IKCSRFVLKWCHKSGSQIILNSGMGYCSGIWFRYNRSQQCSGHSIGAVILIDFGSKGVKRIQREKCIDTAEAELNCFHLERINGGREISSQHYIASIYQINRSGGLRSVVFEIKIIDTGRIGNRAGILPAVVCKQDISLSSITHNYDTLLVIIAREV